MNATNENEVQLYSIGREGKARSCDKGHLRQRADASEGNSLAGGRIIMHCQGMGLW